ncbi:hypothetical protein M2352_001444 [Azospirillum fermentarium]|uniref:hypothetical protein n=1 Tax=Azospirillum fermentarium TaxID=1233114 RepID=UPI00222723B1|nr:hypothetical protein [Azospirillum fermentarium]MCW2245853.1 hypothetical protein [Azospirillum fermentarium]
MTGMMLYLAFGLMILTVVSNRYWRSRHSTTSGTTRKAREKLDSMAGDLETAVRLCQQAAKEHADAQERTAKAEQEMTQTLARLEACRGLPSNRFYVFDRLEPRPGRFWEVAVRHLPQAQEERLPHRTWAGVRRYLLVSDNEREARERIAARFPRKAGFEIVDIRPSALAALTVNPVTQASAFRRRTGEEKPAPAVPRRAMVARN